MAGYAVRRIALLVFVAFGVTLVTFVISQLVPGDPARLVVGPHARPEQVETIRREYGLDRPAPQQYLMYVTRLVRGDLGRSLRTSRPVLDDIKRHLPATLELAVVAIIAVVVLGLPAGILSAVRQDRALDHSSRLVSLAGVSMPIFWLGLLLQLLFYRHLRWLPSGGRFTQFTDFPHLKSGLFVLDSVMALDAASLLICLKHLLLPVAALSFHSMAMASRMTRAAMLEVLRQDYVRTARSKGLTERIIVYRHALKNALIPIITVLGLQFGYLLGGAFLVETIFGWPGMGLYAVESIGYLDFPAIMGATLISTMMYVLINLAVDLSYGLVDPRIKY